MKKLGFLALALVLTGGAGPTPLEAQSRMGGFLDWIHRMSGPRMVGLNLSYTHPWGECGSVDDRHWSARGSDFRALGWRCGWEGRLGVAARGARTGPDDINMYSLQAQLDHYYARSRTGKFELGFGIGLAAHYFTSEAPSFWHWSVPVYPVKGVWHLVEERDRGLSLELNLGLHAFPPFSDDDFGSLTPGMSTEKWELSPAFEFGLGWSFQ